MKHEPMSDFRDSLRESIFDLIMNEREKQLKKYHNDKRYDYEDWVMLITNILSSAWLQGNKTNKKEALIKAGALIFAALENLYRADIHREDFYLKNKEHIDKLFSDFKLISENSSVTTRNPNPFINLELKILKVPNIEFVIDYRGDKLANFCNRYFCESVNNSVNRHSVFVTAFKDFIYYEIGKRNHPGYGLSLNIYLKTKESKELLFNINKVSGDDYNSPPVAELTISQTMIEKVLVLDFYKDISRRLKLSGHTNLEKVCVKMINKTSRNVLENQQDYKYNTTFICSSDYDDKKNKNKGMTDIIQEEDDKELIELRMFIDKCCNYLYNHQEHEILIDISAISPKWI